MKLLKQLWKDKATRFNIITIIAVIALFILCFKLPSKNESGERPVKIINGCEYEIPAHGQPIHKNNCHNPIHQSVDSILLDY